MKYSSLVRKTPTGELYIELPPETMEAMGWDDTTILEWRIHEDGTITLGKVNDSSNEA